MLERSVDNSSYNGVTAKRDSNQHQDMSQYSSSSPQPALEDFELVKVLGEGSFGKVFLVKRKTGPQMGAYFAMKVIKKADLKIRDRLRTQMERNILAAIDHPFIVKLYYAFQNHMKLYLVLEYLRGGDLFTRLSKELMFTECDVKFYLAELALAMDHLHGLGIIYRDLKPENILLDKDGHIKLIDFGLCKEAMYDESVQRTYSFCGTVHYMAPEVVNRLGHGPAADWWSYGVLMFEMLTGKLPFQGANRRDTMERILREKLQMPPTLTQDAQTLLRALFKRNPYNRLGYGGNGLQQLKSMSFFREVHWVELFDRRIAPPFKPSCLHIEDACYFDPEFTKRPPRDSDVSGHHGDATSAKRGARNPQQLETGVDMFPGFDYVAPEHNVSMSSYESYDDDATYGRNTVPFLSPHSHSQAMELVPLSPIAELSLSASQGAARNSATASSSSHQLSQALHPPRQLSSVTHNGKVAIPQSPSNLAFSAVYDMEETSFMSGACGQWHFCSRKDDPLSKAAVKVSQRGGCSLEVEILQEFRSHPNVIRLIEVFEDEHNLYLVTEKPEGGSLLDRVRRVQRFTELQSRQAMFCLANVVAALHHKEIAHFDLRPSIVHYKDAGCTNQSLALCDFEMSKRLQHPPPKQKDLLGVGTALKSNGVRGGKTVEGNNNVAPSAYAADMWSLGVIMYTLLCGKAPFGPCSFRLPQGTQNHRLVVDLHRPEWFAVSIAAKNLLKWLLEIDPLRRPTVDQLLAHPWLKDVDGVNGAGSNRGTASSGRFQEKPVKKASSSAASYQASSLVAPIHQVLSSSLLPSSGALSVRKPNLPSPTASNSIEDKVSASSSGVGGGPSNQIQQQQPRSRRPGNSRSSFTSAVTMVLSASAGDSAAGAGQPPAPSPTHVAVCTPKLLTKPA